MLLIVQILASMAMLLIVAGLIQRKRAREHVRWMMMAFIADIIGLILVEIPPLFDSEKVDPVGGLVTDFSMIKGIHAFVATLSLVFYVLQIRSGKKILAGDRSLLPKHRSMAGIFLVTRTLAYVTMWMV